MTTTKKYPSDITREQFEHIRPILEGARKRTHPRTYDLCDVWNGLNYVLKTGCQWRALPHDYPKWRTVHEYFSIWKTTSKGEKQSILDKVFKKMVALERTKNGRKCTTTFIIIDAQSVKNTDTATQKGYDAGKKVSGIKRHIAVDTNGLPHAMDVTTANVTDRDGALGMIENNEINLKDVLNALVDGGYSGERFAQSVKEIIGATVEVVKRNELHTFKVLPKRWVVERSFGWLEKCRRLWKNCERFLESSLAMMQSAFISLLLRRC
ncbi:MAG: IS5 family transposase [Dehalococcoidia bacterium]|nr:IS5 family transposase [Dehalococcoidia bacterium]